MKLEQMTMILGRYSIFFQGYQLSREIIKSWYDLFSKVSPKDFEPAFRRLITQPGRKFYPTPGELQQELNILPNAGISREYLPISKAPKFQGEKFLDLARGIPTNEFSTWQELENANRYEALDSNGNVYLVQNPDAQYWFMRGTQITYIKEPPQATGEVRSTKPTSARQRG